MIKRSWVLVSLDRASFFFSLSCKKISHILHFSPSTSGAISCSCSCWHQDLIWAEKRESTADRCSPLFQTQLFDFGFTAGWDFSSSHISEPLHSSEGERPTCDWRGEFFSGVEILEVYTWRDEGVEWGEAHWNDSQSFAAVVQRPHGTKMFQRSWYTGDKLVGVWRLWWCGLFSSSAVSRLTCTQATCTVAWWARRTAT